MLSEALPATERLSPAMHLHAALRRAEISVADLAAELGVSPSAVYNQMRQDNPKLETIARYIDAMNRILSARGDRRRWTLESLQHGPDPELSDQTQTGPTQGLQGLEVMSVPLLDSAACGYPDPTLETLQIGHQVVPRIGSAVGPGASPRNTVAIIARGESMTGRDIHDGDALLVRTDLDVRDGDVVLCRYAGALVVKEYRDGRLRSLRGESTEELPRLDDVVLEGIVMSTSHRIRR